MSKVQELYDTLQEKHGGKFKPEQLNAWANMVEMKKHTSLYDLPPGRCFKIQKDGKASKEVEEATVATKSPPKPAELSLTKKVNLRTQCFEQLEKLHDLMQKGGISKEQ